MMSLPPPSAQRHPLASDGTIASGAFIQFLMALTSWLLLLNRFSQLNSFNYNLFNSNYFLKAPLSDVNVVVFMQTHCL